MTTADAVVVGAGIAGVAAAHQLAVRRKVGKVVIVDPRPPLTLTSDKSTECYRNWWPSESMVGLMNRSIDLLEEFSEESNGVFGLSRRGYLFVTADLVKLAVMEAQADVITTFGAGAVRRHPGPVPYGDHADGVDILNQPELAKHFPYLTPEAKGAVHVRRAGWFSAQQFGSWMLEESERNGAVWVVDTVTAIDADGTVSGRPTRRRRCHRGTCRGGCRRADEPGGGTSRGARTAPPLRTASQSGLARPPRCHPP